MTYQDYLDFVHAYQRNHPEQRPGQAAMNVLRMLVTHAHLYDTVRWDLEINPWDDQSQLSAWFRAVEERW